MKFHLHGLYVITDKDLIERENFCSTVESAIKGGAGIVQLREKNTKADETISLGKDLLKITKKHNVPLIINDSPEIAREIEADGVHLGKDDPDVKTARKILGNNKIIGASCYNRIENGIKALRNGADYIVFGTPYKTPTKPGRRSTPIETLYEARRKFRNVPVFAIGGINKSNARAIINTGVDGIAVITGVFGPEDTEMAARELSVFFTGP